MHCPRCQHGNRPQATFCEACGTPITGNPSGPPAPSYAEITSALSEALEQQEATAELLQTRSRELSEAQEQLSLPFNPSRCSEERRRPFVRRTGP
jgi:hypothetical protein